MRLLPEEVPLPLSPEASAVRGRQRAVPSDPLVCRHWGRGGLETGDYMLGTFRAHVHLSHNVTGG